VLLEPSAISKLRPGTVSVVTLTIQSEPRLEKRKPTTRAKWCSSTSAYRCVLQNVLDTADIVIALGKVWKRRNRRRNGETSCWNPAGVSPAWSESSRQAGSECCHSPGDRWVRSVHSKEAGLHAIYEQDFLGCSYGFRPGRGQHQALDELKRVICTRSTGWILELDITAYFDSIVRERLMEMIEKRVSDRSVLRLIRKWIQVGVIDQGQLLVSDQGMGQGQTISPLLANIYLHHGAPG
jgi:hypothetical protein